MKLVNLEEESRFPGDENLFLNAVGIKIITMGVRGLEEPLSATPGIASVDIIKGLLK